jgi:hypothetical protein
MPILAAAAQLDFAEFVFPALPRRRRPAGRKSLWQQLSLPLGQASLLDWKPALAPVIPLRPRRVRAAEDLTLPRREIDWKPPPEQKSLFDQWEKLLKKEGMPAELSADGYCRISDERMEYLAAPEPGMRPTLARRGKDSEGARLEHPTSRGAWWHGEIEPDEDGRERWAQMGDAVREIVDEAIEEALAGTPGAVLTGPQASVLRGWFEGRTQVEIAGREGHSKVTVHHKLHRALRVMVEVVRRAMGDGA